MYYNYIQCLFLNHLWIIEALTGINQSYSTVTSDDKYAVYQEVHVGLIMLVHKIPYPWLTYDSEKEPNVITLLYNSIEMRNKFHSDLLLP